MNNEKFEKIKENVSELVMFLKAMPKGGDLHNHSLGGGYSELIYEKAILNNSYYDLGTHKFLDENEYQQSDKNQDIKTIEALERENMEDYLNNYSVRGLKNKKSGADHFFNTFVNVLSTKVKEEELVLEVLKRNQLENISYVEMISDCIPETLIEKFENSFEIQEDFNLNEMKEYCEILEKNITDENILELKDFLNKRENYLKKNGVENIEVGYMPYLRRVSSDLKTFFTEAFLFILSSCLDPRIVGVNIVETEDSLKARRNFNSHLKILKYLYLYFQEKFPNKKINLSIHAGELTLEREALENMKDRIISTIFLERDKNKREKVITKRIGHGVSIQWETFETLEVMKKNKIPVEICLTSNEIILGIEGENHPFNLYKKYGVPMVICTDDEAVSRSNIVMEYLKAVKRYDLNYLELKALIKNTLEFSFLEGESLYMDGDYKTMRAEFSGIKTIEELEKKTVENKKLIFSNKKLKMQLELEKKILEFERNY
ncbi:hypothetical protein [Fusobacterium sp. MFO224]|uniref:hypothetical protein n=1 Tax=Fusobacterium sp. MFO224 TaxID=3378070 RepID=UPI0038546253